MVLVGGECAHSPRQLPGRIPRELGRGPEPPHRDPPSQGFDMNGSQGRNRREVRSLFVSDVHLGCRHAHPHEFLQFLDRYAPEQLYIVGDFIDWWKLRRSHAWEQIFNDILARLYEMHQQGTRIYYTPGNHDAFLRAYSWGFPFVTICDEIFIRLEDGRRFLVTHGDKFDRVECAAGWVSVAASIGYDALLSANWVVSRCRQQPRRGQYAFSATVKRAVKQVVKYISDFEQRLAGYARSRGCDGVICGHIHTPLHTTIHGITYANTGDWVENCTAFVEYDTGVLELIRYLDADCLIEPSDAGFPRSDFALSDAELPLAEPLGQPEPEVASVG